MKLIKQYLKLGRIILSLLFAMKPQVVILDVSSSIMSFKLKDRMMFFQAAISWAGEKKILWFCFSHDIRPGDIVENYDLHGYLTNFEPVLEKMKDYKEFKKNLITDYPYQGIPPDWRTIILS